jgi:anti-anti-sigma factor
MGQVDNFVHTSAATDGPPSHVLHGGYYDLSRKSELKAEFDAIEPHSDVVIDLASTEHLDCSCIGVMVGRLREWRVRKPETQLRLINVTPRLERMLRLLMLQQLFVINPA